MDNDYSLVYYSDKEYKISILCALLEDNSIKYNVINKKDSMYKFGYIELYVNNEDIETVKKIIKSSTL